MEGPGRFSRLGGMRRSVCLAALSAILCLPAGAGAASGAPPWLKLAKTELPQLRVAPAAPMTGYSRTKFGPATGDSDATGWLPPNTSFDCRYVARQIAIKTTYDLWLTKPEHDAIATLLAHC